MIFITAISSSSLHQYFRLSPIVITGGNSDEDAAQPHYVYCKLASFQSIYQPCGCDRLINYGIYSGLHFLRPTWSTILPLRGTDKDENLIARIVRLSSITLRGSPRPTRRSGRLISDKKGNHHIIPLPSLSPTVSTKAQKLVSLFSVGPNHHPLNSPFPSLPCR